MDDALDKTANRQAYLARLLVVLPAFNEERSLRLILPDLRKALPGVPVVVVNDGSSDKTAEIARNFGATLIDLPHNLGVGGAMQTAFQYAIRTGRDAVLRLDADGQHPPSEAVKLIDKHLETQADLVVGSRFGTTEKCVSTGFRYAGNHGLSFFLSRICRVKISDPTSGFWLVSGPLVEYFAHDFPTDYPEPEAIALMRRLGFSYAEVPVRFRNRLAGKSSILPFDTLHFIVRVGLALVVDRFRHLDVRYSHAGLVRARRSRRSHRWS